MGAASIPDLAALLDHMSHRRLLNQAGVAGMGVSIRQTIKHNSKQATHAWLRSVGQGEFSGTEW